MTQEDRDIQVIWWLFLLMEQVERREQLRQHTFCQCETCCAGREQGEVRPWHEEGQFLDDPEPAKPKTTATDEELVRGLKASLWPAKPKPKPRPTDPQGRVS